MKIKAAIDVGRYCELASPSMKSPWEIFSARKSDVGRNRQRRRESRGTPINENGNVKKSIHTLFRAFVILVLYQVRFYQKTNAIRIGCGFLLHISLYSRNYFLKPYWLKVYKMTEGGTNKFFAQKRIIGKNVASIQSHYLKIKFHCSLWTVKYRKCGMRMAIGDVHLL